ncbi:MAG: NYN domain-containing protein [Chlamydiae bacterium]|nr:NYN domain-containing protein [Chlamydiota bacterium]MBI3267220.1 NYN domain-containing protein [Chlamydiota bacterium]
MLRYELEKREKSLEEISQLKAQNDHFQKTQIHLEKKLKNLEILLQEKEEDLAHIKEEIKKEALIKKEAKKAVKSPTPRVAIFVDVQNIYYAAKEKYEGKLDFQKLLYETLQGRKLVKAVAYVVITPEIKQTNFISTLESIGYEIKLKNLKIRLDGSAKGDWDLGIAIDTLLLADKMDVAVLVSGDGDFVDLVRMLKAKNIRVEVASFPHNTSGDLIDSVDFHFTLDEKILLPS